MPAKGRNTRKALDWKKAVFERDNYLCQHCNVKGKKIVAHHIVEWKKNESLRYVVNNGLTLCVSCHRAHHNKTMIHPWKGKKLPDEIKEKMKNAKLGRKLSYEHKQKLSVAQKKVIHSEERNKKISEAKKGIRFSEEHKKKLSTVKIGKVTWNKGLKGNKSHMYGRAMNHAGKSWKIDPETKKRIWY